VFLCVGVGVVVLVMANWLAGWLLVDKAETECEAKG